MVTSSGAEGIAGSVNQWSRILGVSLRPWTGRSPLGLIVRGTIQVAINVYLFSLLTRLAKGDEFTATTGEMDYLRNFALIGMVVVVVVGLLGALKIVIGVLDLFPRSTITGTVISVRDRKLGDFLPTIAQRMIFERNAQALDKRKLRKELVLQTPDGIRQWTIRKTSVLRELDTGTVVQVTVSPLVGYVSSVQKADAPNL